MGKMGLVVVVVWSMLVSFGCSTVRAELVDDIDPGIFPGFEFQVYTTEVPRIRPEVTAGADETPRTYSLYAAVVRPSFRAGKRTRDVIVYIPGGPGGEGIVPPGQFERDLSRQMDLLLLDQRGIAWSDPDMLLTERLPEDPADARERVARLLARRALQGLPLEGINSREAQQILSIGPMNWATIGCSCTAVHTGHGLR
ncbi:hypothetical protein [Spirochaeta africana]|uniref:Uncharacterized protein n=1 Tax=Spirochaeta africana (strain ATCC 700263 / DSM 8902 / Z-7692) TaxID=889378 RepID=H9UHW7_SPIAZ|nr:hypothetical protein [Spirochaeta africana]AFG37110.1 hypothetical protein Spiaf_1023 [Spirochaeta africana DSM 8902]